MEGDMLAQLLTLLIVVAILGFAIWVVITYIPMPQPMKTAIVVFAILIMLLWFVQYVLGGRLLAAG
jgi:uncharacterized membrane protein